MWSLMSVAQRLVKRHRRLAGVHCPDILASWCILGLVTDPVPKDELEDDYRSSPVSTSGL